MRFKLVHASRRAYVRGTLLCTLAAVGCGSPTDGGSVPGSDSLGESQTPVVYGNDNRTDVYAHPNATLRALAQQSTVALMQPGRLNTSNPNNVIFNANTLGVSLNLCSTERFLRRYALRLQLLPDERHHAADRHHRGHLLLPVHRRAPAGDGERKVPGLRHRPAGSGGHSALHARAHPGVEQRAAPEPAGVGHRFGQQHPLQD